MTGTPIALTIAGSDSSGGAGIQADLKTFSAFGVYGASVITALTAQNTLGVTAVEPVAAAFVVAQMEAVLSDLEVGAIKTGMLANAGIVEAVARRLRDGPRRPLVVDPVMVATSGDVLLEADAVDAMKRELFPLALLITPNLPEAARLLDAREATSEAEVTAQAQALLALGCQAVLLKGGHGSGEEAVDILCDAAGIERFVRRVSTRATRTARAARFRPPSRPCSRRASGCGRPSAAPKPSFGRPCRRGARWASAAATGRSTTCSPSAGSPADLTSSPRSLPSLPGRGRRSTPVSACNRRVVWCPSARARRWRKGYTADRQRRRKRELHLSNLDNLARWHFTEGVGNDRMSRQATASASLALAFVMATAAGNGAAAGPIEDLSGYWTGAGTVLLTNGSTERVKCAVIYKVGGSGTQIKQTLRCASADYNINAAAELRVNGAQVSGNWEEKTYRQRAMWPAAHRQQLRAVDQGPELHGRDECRALELQAVDQHHPARPRREAYLHEPREVLTRARARPARQLWRSSHALPDQPVIVASPLIAQGEFGTILPVRGTSRRPSCDAWTLWHQRGIA